MKPLYETILDIDNNAAKIDKKVEDIDRIRKDVIKWLKDTFGIDYLLHNDMGLISTAKRGDPNGVYQKFGSKYYIETTSGQKKNFEYMCNGVMKGLKQWDYRRISDRVNVVKGFHDNLYILTYSSDEINDASILFELKVGNDGKAMQLIIQLGQVFKDILPGKNPKEI